MDAMGASGTSRATDVQVGAALPTLRKSKAAGERDSDPWAGQAAPTPSWKRPQPWIFSPFASIATSFPARSTRVSGFFAVCTRQHTA